MEPICVFRGMTIQDIWASSPERFYAETVAEIDTFAGVAAATMYRDEGWRFLNLGRAIERVQLSSALLQAQILAAERTRDVSEAAWTGLLRLYHALEAYHRTYGLTVEPRQVLDLLATDARLPDSLCRSPGHALRRTRRHRRQPQRSGRRCCPTTHGSHERPGQLCLAGPG